MRDDESVEEFVLRRRAEHAKHELNYYRDAHTKAVRWLRIIVIGIYPLIIIDILATPGLWGR